MEDLSIYQTHPLKWPPFWDLNRPKGPHLWPQAGNSNHEAYITGTAAVVLATDGAATGAAAGRFLFCERVVFWGSEMVAGLTGKKLSFLGWYASV